MYCHSSIVLLSRKAWAPIFFGRLSLAALLWVGLFGNISTSRGEAVPELFSVKWADLTAKMPELAETGYDSLWLRNSAKGERDSYSVGYDLFDLFDLGDKNQP